MRTKNYLWVLALLIGAFTAKAGQLPTCVDWNGYVNSKNTGGTGFYTLSNGFEEQAAQTYHFSGQGILKQVRVYGNYPTLFSGGVPLRVTIYNVDANGRPTTGIQSVNDIWWWYDNAGGFIDVSFGAGVNVTGNFAVGVGIRQAWPFGSSFQVRYTGNGEGLGKDLASLAGTSTGGNWVSALTNFSKDGDFYLVPQMQLMNSPGFEVASSCVAPNANITFTNTSLLTRDSMFNRISLAGYNGGNTYYSWDFGDGTPSSTDENPNHSFAAPGVYTVTLTSKIEGWEGLCAQSYSMDISVGLSVKDTITTQIKCNGAATAVVKAIGSGGATPYTYSIDNITYQSSNTFSGLTAGNYTLYITDALGCTATKAFTISQPTPVVFATPQITNASCGTANGQILVSASGGTGTKKYKIGSGAYQNSGLFTGLAAGSYTITARDGNQCTTSIQITVNDQGAPELTVSSVTHVSCFGGNDGSITLTGSNGTGALQYSINGGTTYQSSGSFTSLTAGYYAVLVKDAANCKSGAQVIINQPTQLKVVAEAKGVSCHGGNNGQINILSGIGGIGALSYSLNGVNYQSGTNFSGLSAGTYTVYIRDVAGCTASATVNVTQPSDIAASVTTTNPSCSYSYDGVITVSAAGGSGSYSYSINGLPYQASGTFNYLSGGSYTIVVRDKRGCTHTVNAQLTAPAQLNGSVATTNSTCGSNNGGLLVTASGGSGSGYQYSLDGTTFTSSGLFNNLASGTYYVAVKDGAGCINVVSGTIFDSNGPSITSVSHTNISCNGGSDGSITVNTVSGGTGVLQYALNGANWQNSTSFTGLPAGTYNVMVKDANGCIGTITEVLTQPAAFTINNAVKDLTCYGVNQGRITVTAIGGAGTLTYSLNGGVSYQSSNVFNNLGAGLYVITVKDAAGCKSTAQAFVSQPEEIVASTGVLDVTCHGDENGVISVLSWGGTGPKTYSLDGNNYQSGNSFDELSGGSYTLYIKDSVGCVVSTPVSVFEPAALSLSALVNDVTCSGGDNGSVNLTVNGGVGEYEFHWNEKYNEEDIFNLDAGTYAVTVTDGNGCTIDGTYFVSQPFLPLIVNGTVTPSNGNDGAIDITITGGTEPYTFNWTNGSTTEDLTQLPAGTYTVEVTDYNGCATSNTFTVSDLTGVNNIALATGVKVYPNPANGYVVVEVKEGELSFIELVDMLGRQVLAQSAVGQKAQIPVAQLAEGAYMIRITLGDNRVIKQLQVTH